MDILTPIKHSNSQIVEATTPRTAVFVGATDGIGRNALNELVSTGSPLRIYIVGRDQTQHQHIVDELHAINSNAELIYIEGQISLMSEVKRITEDINRREQKIDLFYHSAGFLPFTGRQGVYRLLFDD
jgi:NADP-dependent 3-hydroxy acid dehydrogenase YdfG